MHKFRYRYFQENCIYREIPKSMLQLLVKESSTCNTAKYCPISIWKAVVGTLSNSVCLRAYFPGFISGMCYQYLIFTNLIVEKWHLSTIFTSIYLIMGELGFFFLMLESHFLSLSAGLN